MQAWAYSNSAWLVRSTTRVSGYSVRTSLVNSSPSRPGISISQNSNSVGASASIVRAASALVAYRTDLTPNDWKWTPAAMPLSTVI